MPDIPTASGPSFSPTSLLRDRNRRILLVIAVILISATTVLIFLPPNTDLISTPLPPTDRNESPLVEPLALTGESRLEIHAPGFHAEFASSGEGMIIRADPAPMALQASRTLQEIVTLDSNTFRQLLTDLARVKSTWGARQVGEAAVAYESAPPLLRETNETTTIPGSEIIVRERKVDGTYRTILRIAPGGPEYEDALAALAPLRLR